ncbi:MAG TPA: hypothetical protein VHI31_06440, partial [Actinomycetota bacterium]|nr:hypothetical protein [Actinomycetota bacterium]
MNLLISAGEGAIALLQAFRTQYRALVDWSFNLQILKGRPMSTATKSTGAEKVFWNLDDIYKGAED